MIKLDYQLSPSWNRQADSIDFATVEEIALRYEVLLGDVILTVNSDDFSAKRGWVPVVDFVISLRQIALELAEGNDVVATFTFTESDATLRFRKNGETVFISASYATSEAQVSFKEFTVAVESFSIRVAGELTRIYPSLQANDAFALLFLHPKGSREH